MSFRRQSLTVVAWAYLAVAAWACGEARDPLASDETSPPDVSPPALPVVAPVYAVTPIAAVTGLRINQSGDVVGWRTVGGANQPILYTRETGVIVLPTSAAEPYGVARDLSNRSAGLITVVGEARLGSTSSAVHAVRWHVAVPLGTVTGVEDLGVLPGHSQSFAYGVNDAGQIVGTSDPNSFLSIRSFIYLEARGAVDLGLGGVGQNARALDLNASGFVTGYLGLQAMRWSAGGGVELLGAPSGWANSFGFAINASGQVAGTAASASGNAERIARYTDGIGWEILGGMGQQNRGNGINRWGDVVGTGIPHGPFVRGVIFTEALGSLTLIEDLLHVRGSWTVMEAYDINDAQQITGWAINRQTGLRSAVLLTPVRPSLPELPR